MPTFTQKRSTPAPMGYFATNIYGVSTHPSWNLLRMGTSQVTTSFRTGDGHQEVSDREASAIRRNAFTSFDDRYDTGHPFSTLTAALPRISHPNFEAVGQAGTRAYYRGPLLLRGGKPSEASVWTLPPNIPEFTGLEIGGYGSTAIGRTRPLQPVAGLSTALGELLHDGLPALVGLATLKERSNHARSAGGEYLNVQFGWAPLLSDIRSIAAAVTRASRIILQAQRDSGRNVRRSYNFPEIVSSQDTSFGNDQWLDPPGISDTSWMAYIRRQPQEVAVSTRTVTTTQKVWFKAAYSYHLDVGSSYIDKLSEFEQKANLLLGTRVTPEVLWNLAPWSWLADWFATAGNLLGNLTAFQDDDLVMRYGYLMRTTAQMTVVHTPFLAFGRSSAKDVTNTFHVVRKERVKATPYGFGLNPGSFSPRQWAILAALGMTSSPTSLR